MLLKRSISVVLLFLPAFFLSSGTAKGCSCANQPTVQKEYDWASVVVVTQMVSVEKGQTPTTRDRVQLTTMLVEKVFKGSIKLGEEMIFAQGGGADCIWTFSEKDIGQRYLFYLTPGEGVKDKLSTLWRAVTCGRSKRLDHAADDMLYLENISKVRGKTRLSGTLSFYQPPVVEDQEPTETTLPGKRVRVIGEKTSYESITNKDGVYEIYDLPPGRYRVDPEIPTGWRIDDSDASNVPPRNDVSRKENFDIVVEAGTHAYRDFRYGVNNIIRGRVLNPDAVGMKDVCVKLIPADGKASRYFYEVECTDAEGSFEIVGVPSGRYLIAANDDGKISSNEPFRTVYYPNTFQREKAAVVNVGTGHTLEGIDIIVPKTEPLITIEGVVLFADAKPVTHELVYFRPGKTADGVDGQSTALTDEAGRFSIRILKGLTGKLYSETYQSKFQNCPAIEKLVRESGSTSITLRTNVVDIRAEDDASKVELRYPFQGCVKKTTLKP